MGGAQATISRLNQHNWNSEMEERFSSRHPTAGLDKLFGSCTMRPVSMHWQWLSVLNCSDTVTHYCSFCMFVWHIYNSLRRCALFNMSASVVQKHVFPPERTQMHNVEIKMHERRCAHHSILAHSRTHRKTTCLYACTFNLFSASHILFVSHSRAHIHTHTDSPAIQSYSTPVI